MTNTNIELPINKYLDRYKDIMEVGVKPETGSFELLTQTINTDSWGSRNINFNINNIALNRLILGHRCFLNFTGTATNDDGTNITAADDIELRDGAGNLILESINVQIAGSNVHTDSTALVTRHYYEHLVNKNSERAGHQHEDRYITDEAEVYIPVAGTIINDGIRITSITDGKRFSLLRPLTDVTFFGKNDSAIPSSLPITLDIRLTSRPERIFNGNNANPIPRFRINTVELYIYTIQMEDSLASSLNERLRTGELLAVSDTWGSRNSGISINADDSVVTSQNETVLSTTPDLVGIVFLPNDNYNPANAFGGRYPLRSSWLNFNTFIIKSGGAPIRYYKELGDRLDVGLKTQLTEELKNLYECNVSPLDNNSFVRGDIGFYPLINRPIDDMYVLPPKPFSLSFEAMTNDGVADASTCFYFYKLRHQWVLSSQYGQSKIIK